MNLFSVLFPALGSYFPSKDPLNCGGVGPLGPSGRT